MVIRDLIVVGYLKFFDRFFLVFYSTIKVYLHLASIYFSGEGSDFDLTDRIECP